MERSMTYTYESQYQWTGQCGLNKTMITDKCVQVASTKTMMLYRTGYQSPGKYLWEHFLLYVNIIQSKRYLLYNIKSIIRENVSFVMAANRNVSCFIKDARCQQCYGAVDLWQYMSRRLWSVLKINDTMVCWISNHWYSLFSIHHVHI